MAAVALLVAFSYAFDTVEHIVALKDWIHDQGVWGFIAFIAMFALASLAGTPGTPLTAAAGALLGTVWGVVAASIGSLISACAAFLIARYAARESIAQWISNKQSFQRLDRLTSRHGAVMVAFTRIVPVAPLPVVNYGYGLTGIRFSTYAVWSWLCMLPGIILFVAGADILTEMLMAREFRWSFVWVVTLRGTILAVMLLKFRKLYREYPDNRPAKGICHGQLRHVEEGG